MSTEIASAYIALYTKMPGVKADITNSLGGSDVQSGLKSSGSSMGNVISGAIGGAVALGAAKAVAVVTGAINGAIGRVDTMNNFPKIMSNLGFSTEDASKSIKVMSDRLMGLPTSLDAMTGMVQQLAPLTGSLDQATNLSLAFNNALLAGGKSTDIQSNAMEQYTQMLSTGKVDMAAWRSIVTAMPGQMDQLSKSLLGAGATSTDLYGAMQDGTIGFDQFNAAVLDLDKNGSAGFSSFAKQAKDSTDGIATGQANLNTAITRGLANIIQEYQPEITGLLAGVTAFVNDAFKAVSGFVEWVSANKEWLTPFAIGLGIAAVAVALVTAAQWAWNIAAYANPLTWIILAIGVLIGIILLLVMNWDTVVKFITDIWGGFIGWLTDGLNAVMGWWNGLWTAVWQFIVDVWNNIVAAVVGYFTNLWNSIVAIGAGIASFWSGMWNGIVGAFTTIFGAIGGIVQGVFDGVVGFIKGYINTIIRLVNGAIDGLNGVGDFISGITGGAVDFTIGHIPMLAAGGTITGAGSVLVGERGPEILNLNRGASVVPLDRAGSSGATLIYQNYGSPGMSSAEELFAAAGQLKRRLA